MCKQPFLAVLIVGLISMVGFTQDTSVNVNSAIIPELATVPVIDGDLSDWADIPETVFTAPDGTVTKMDQSGDSPAADPGTGDLDIVLKVAWDDETNALYFAVNVKDEAFVATQGLGSTAGTNGWQNERLEIVIDGTNTGDAASTTTTGLHQQYTFDVPNTWDIWGEGNDIENKVFIAGEVGLFNVLDGGIPVSTSFVRVPVFERIEGTLNFDNSHAPWDIWDEFVESAAQIRVTNAGATEWIEASVEINWEIKLVPYEFLYTATMLGFDIGDPANIENGWQDLFKDEANIKLDLEPNKVIGFSPQQNDADVWDPAPSREHQTNTTGVSGNWNSSESLSGLILGAKEATILDWSIQ